MFNRKGDLALSTNAIVVLIIAVLVLGLLISFITGAIGKGSDRFLGELNKLPDPPQPTASRIITSSESAVAQRGDYAGFKFSVYNPFPAENNVAPTFVECGPVETSVSLAPRVVAGRGVETWTVQAPIKEAASIGKTVCTVSVTITDASGEKAIGNSDVVIEVRS